MATLEEARQSKYSAAEWQMRVDLAACYRLADMFGFSDIVWNHITAKVPDSEEPASTPTIASPSSAARPNVSRKSEPTR